MRTKVIREDAISSAVYGILYELENTTSKENIIYFDGWEGMGASSVLRAVAQRLTSERFRGLAFELVIQIDYSKWKSRRALQREITEQLELPSWVMELFDKQDEDDDFSGINRGSRTEIEVVTAEIHRSMESRTFLLVLHNGHNEEIDMFNLGLNLGLSRYGQLSNKMLWTFRGKFRLDPRLRDKVVKNNKTDVLISASPYKRDPHDLWSYLLREEATQVSRKHGVDPATVVECFSYMLERSYMGQNIIDYDWASHASNFWICDGIIQQEEWRLGNALHQDMELCIDKLSRQEEGKEEVSFESHMKNSAHHRPYWFSTASCGFVLNPTRTIPNNIFQNSDKLSVIKLSQCAFSFLSPPFLYCHSLRFLCLDRCKNLQRSICAKEGKEIWACFQSLWILDLRYVDLDWILSAQMMDLMTQLIELNIMGADNWDMSHLRGRLRNIRKLRVTKSTFCNNGGSILFSEMEQMEILEFSGNKTRQRGISLLSLCSGLMTVVVDGSDGLAKISLQGCSQLKNFLLRGWLKGLEELDVSGTTLQTIDLSAACCQNLKRLLLLGCQELRSIPWPPRRMTRPKEINELCIDTTLGSKSDNGSEGNLADSASTRSSSTAVNKGKALHAHPPYRLKEHKAQSFYRWRISITDARLLRSLGPVIEDLRQASPETKYELARRGCLHIDMCPAAALGGRNVQGTMSSCTSDKHTSILVDSKYRDICNHDGDDGATPSATTTMMWDCPEIYFGDDYRSCIIEMIVDASFPEDFPKPIYGLATSLHVYDSSSITSISAPSEYSWLDLRWCRVDRCPNMDTVFNTPKGGKDVAGCLFLNLTTFWASQLLTARYVWNWPSGIYFPRYSVDYHMKLEFLHLDYCPRLIHVLPVDARIRYSLRTIEIVCCGDLMAIFPSNSDKNGIPDQSALEMPNLERIHLCELPKLQHICGLQLTAPKLKTVKIKGCWSLKRLPAVCYKTEPPKVDCEKEWWDSLDWDGLAANHHPSLYQPTHSAYYKNQLPRVSLLR